MRIREDLAKHPLDKTLEAIDRGDQQLAKKYAQEIWDEGRPLHDLYGDMCALFCTYIADRLGEEAVEEVWRMIGNELWKPVLMQVKENGGTAALVEVYASFLRAHGYKFYAEEDNEKVVFYADYCGSGGRMMMEGKIEGNPAHSVNMGATKKPYKWSCNRENFPYYCVHTPLWMDMMPREWGWDVFKSEDGYNGLCCGKTTIYKEPQSQNE